MKKIALFLALAVLPGVASAELTDAEADICVGMKLLADSASLEKQKGVSHATLYSRLANHEASDFGRAIAYAAVDMVFDGYTPFDVRKACVDALK